MTSDTRVSARIQPELWAADPRGAIALYEAAFGATALHLVGKGDDIVAQLAVGDAAFWVSPASPTLRRLDHVRSTAQPAAALVVNDPGRSCSARSSRSDQTLPVASEHGWQIGRITDPFGHAWEIGKPVEPWPPH